MIIRKRKNTETKLVIVLLSLFRCAPLIPTENNRSVIANEIQAMISVRRELFATHKLNIRADLYGSLWL